MKKWDEARLASAYAAGGRADRAVDIPERAVALAANTEEEELLARLRQRLERLRAGTPSS